MTKWYAFRQNNSGGFWRGPAINVVIEAANPSDANIIAMRHGIYFDGIEKGFDCACCGDRWSWADEYSAYDTPDGGVVPSLVGNENEDGEVIPEVLTIPLTRN